ncbi:hypothetical protein SEPCBS119000_005077 [Sporothrix epigloea]|uniref:Ubiquitin-like domain-containing protein n=1 Tax=Sporothrix epigloea TaxID=1892477 RepID=A0ABP0DVM9_9PEZI
MATCALEGGILEVEALVVGAEIAMTRARSEEPAKGFPRQRQLRRRNSNPAPSSPFRSPPLLIVALVQLASTVGPLDDLCNSLPLDDLLDHVLVRSLKDIYLWTTVKMGCCLSRSEGPNSSFPGGAPNGANRAIDVSPPSGGISSLMTAALSNATNSRGAAVAGASPAQATDSGRISSSSTPSSESSQQLQANSVGFARAAGLTTFSSSSSQQPAPPALASHINKPIRRRRWTSRSRVWTRQSIDRERTDFFDTRVTGRAEVWQTLHAALEIMWEADLVDGARRDAASGSREATPPTSPASPPTTGNSTENDEARATAQSILDAADITLPTGDMVQGAYDVFGNYYALPAHIVSDPTNLENDPEHNQSDLDETKGALDDMAGDGNLSEDSDGHSSSDDEDGGGRWHDKAGHHSAVSPENSASGAGTEPAKSLHARHHCRREDKGKAIAAATSASTPAANQITVRARLSATSRDVLIQLGREETVRSLERRIVDEAQLPHKTRIRIAYLGRILKDNASLLAQGWKEGHVVNALVFEASV